MPVFPTPRNPSDRPFASSRRNVTAPTQASETLAASPSQSTTPKLLQVLDYVVGATAHRKGRLAARQVVGGGVAVRNLKQRRRRSDTEGGGAEFRCHGRGRAGHKYAYTLIVRGACLMQHLRGRWTSLARDHGVAHFIMVCFDMHVLDIHVL